MKILHWIVGICTLLLSIIYYYPAFLYVLIFLIYSVILIALAVYGTLYFHHKIYSQNPSIPTVHKNTLYNAVLSPKFDLPKPMQIAQYPIIFGRTVDGLVLQIIEYAFRDFVFPWLEMAVRQPKNLSDILRADIWNGIQKLSERTQNIDCPKLIAVDMCVRVAVHLEKIRISESRALETGSTPLFKTNVYLETEDTEIEFLRRVCEMILILLLPQVYSISPVINLLSEMISYKVMYPLIKLFTSPDFINQKIVQFIETRLAVAAINKRSYEYAASFEDFLKIINTTQSIDELLLIRTSIVNDIIQATTMQNLQNTKKSYCDSDNDHHHHHHHQHHHHNHHHSSSSNSKSKLTSSSSSALSSSSSSSTIPTGSIASGLSSSSSTTSAAKLKRYIQQLSFAKANCEKNLSKLGWTGNFSNDLNMSLLEILSTVIGRRYFTLFLEPLQANGLIGFYSAVEELKHSQKTAYHQLGSEIFYTYIRAPITPIKIKKPMRLKMESFLLGDCGPDVFFDAQKLVLTILEDNYYSAFLNSPQYQELKEAISNEEIKEISNYSEITDGGQNQFNCSGGGDSEVSADLENHSTYARTKIEQLQEKLDNKMLALIAVTSSVQPESKLLTILGKEVEWLKMEKRQLEAHLTRTETWGENLGKWRSIVQSVEVIDEKDPPRFMILVHIDECSEASENGKIESENISTGWVVLRSLTEFHELHRKLRPLCPELKSMDLPSTAFKLFFQKNDKSSLEKAKIQIQKYLNFIMVDDVLYQSEAIYSFLSPSSDHLKQGSPVQKKTKFSLLTLFKSNSSSGTPEHNKNNDPYWGPCGPRDSEGDLLQFLEGAVPDTNNSDSNHKSNIEVDGKDSIAEPLYSLIGEIFDMGGVFNKWLRRNLLSFVQITYGRTINRQIRESINYIFDEQMLHFYASSILKSFWPGSVLISKQQIRSEDMQEMTGNAAKSLLIDNIPEVLCNLIGAQTAKQGILKVFNVVQNPKYNKQLFYELFEMVLVEAFPEIKELVESSTMNSSSDRSSFIGGGTANTNTSSTTTTTTAKPKRYTIINKSPKITTGTVEYVGTNETTK